MVGRRILSPGQDPPPLTIPVKKRVRNLIQLRQIHRQRFPDLQGIFRHQTIPGNDLNPGLPRFQQNFRKLRLCFPVWHHMIHPVHLHHKKQICFIARLFCFGQLPHMLYGPLRRCIRKTAHTVFFQGTALYLHIDPARAASIRRTFPASGLLWLLIPVPSLLLVRRSFRFYIKVKAGLPEGSLRLYKRHIRKKAA